MSDIMLLRTLEFYGYEERYYIFIQNENGHGLCKLRAYAHYFQGKWFKKSYGFLLPSI